MAYLVCMRVKDEPDPIEGSIKMICTYCFEPIWFHGDTADNVRAHGHHMEGSETICQVCFLKIETEDLNLKMPSKKQIQSIVDHFRKGRK